MSRILLLCLDGTRNEPEAGSTNVALMYDMAVKDSDQLAYYDPGVGTMGARSATTAFGKTLTRVRGLAAGYGIKENVEEAYTWLMEHYRLNDRIFVVGFSRGAYTALALVGMLRTVGLLRPGAANLVPYALKLYAATERGELTPDEKREYWKTRDDFNTRFGNPEWPNRFSTHQIAFLGLWDTVKTVGRLNARARFEEVRWPFTHKIPNVEVARLAMALDEWRRPYPEYRFDAKEAEKRPDAIQELWFPGVHCDVGGTYEDNNQLSNIALKWMADEAAGVGLRIDHERYERLVGVPPGTPLPESDAVEGWIHSHSRFWWVAGLPRARNVRTTDARHPSVDQRIEGTAGSKSPYRPDLRRVP